MCVDADEVWEDVARRTEHGRCKDCGHTGVMSVADLVNYDDEGEENIDRARELLWNDGVPDWTGDMFVWGGEIWTDPTAVADVRWEVEYDLARDLPAEVKDTEVVCELCAEAQRWLTVWCNAYIWNRYRDDILDHWYEDEINRTYTMARLVVACRRRWVINGRRISPDRARALVDASLEELQAAKKAAMAR